VDAVLWIGVAIVATGIAVWSARRRAGRQRQLMLLCHRAGLQFAPLDPFQNLWLPFALFGKGNERGTENAVWDERDDGTVRAFDFWFVENEPGSGSWGTKSRLSCAVAELPFSCPRLSVAPEDALDAIAGRLVGDELDLELDAFNRRFRVHADDERFAVAFLDQRMMEATLRLPDRVSLTVNEDRLLLTAPLLPAAEVLLLLEATRLLGERVPMVVKSLYPPRPQEAPQEARWLLGHWSPDPPG
jgi:hypothetical protein